MRQSGPFHHVQQRSVLTHVAIVTITIHLIWTGTVNFKGFKNFNKKMIMECRYGQTFLRSTFAKVGRDSPNPPFHGDT